MKKLLLSFLGIIFCLSLSAQEYGKRHFARVQKAHAAGVEFARVNLFTAPRFVENDFTREAIIFQPDKAAIFRLFSEHPKALTFSVQAASGKTYTLEMVAAQPTSADARIGYIDELGNHKTPLDLGHHYQGSVKGFEKSVAAMSVFANGEVMVLFSNGEGNFNIGKLEDNSGNYILYNSLDRLKEMPFNCMTEDKEMEGYIGNAEGKGTGAIECKKLRIYWECDYTFFQTKGTLAATQNYLLGLFNFMQSIYYNEGMAIEMSSMYIWTVDDPITTTNAYDASFQFQRYWLALNHTYYGEQAHHISDFFGWQGYAYIGAICFPNGYASSNLIGQQSQTYPVFDLDVYIVSHETGHTIGAQHTQSCSWKTGPGGTCGSVDNCVTQEGGAGCSSCFYQHDATATGFKGTIMSYCSTKIDFSEGFGQVVGDFLRSKMSSGSCFKNVIEPEFTVRNICNNDGAITINYKSNNFGVAPYIYSWSGGQQTKDINGLTAPGAYYVSITDSNSCSITDTAMVEYFSKPGDGIALTGTLPYCCKDTSYAVTITSKLPEHLTDCHTVAWLRTKQPISSYADAKTAYANSAGTDIMQSDNSLSIDNDTAAFLNIMSPSACDTTVAYYYTPFLTRKQVAKQVYTASAINQVPVKSVSTNLGYTMQFADQNNMLSACEGAWQNVTDTIIVTVSNYTGRANNMSIMINGADNSLLHLKTDYAGNGTYRIPIETTDAHLQKMVLKVYDYNCVSATVCTSCTLTVQATREVTYHELQALSFDSSCTVGASVLLSFGPDNCNVGIGNIAAELQNFNIHPNPATEDVTISFNSAVDGQGNILLTDAAGKKVSEVPMVYNYGNNNITLSVAGIAKGVYFVIVNSNEGSIRSKIMVQ